MLLRQFQIEGLGHLSTLIADEQSGVAAVVDPRRDVDVYVEAARERDLRISHVVETHLHNDYVSGARELAALTGADQVIGAGAELGYERLARDVGHGDAFSVGALRFSTLETPGHTPEHVAYAVADLVRDVAGLGRPAWPADRARAYFGGRLGRPRAPGSAHRAGRDRGILAGWFSPLAGGRRRFGVERPPDGGAGCASSRRVGAAPPDRCPAGFRVRGRPRPRRGAHRSRGAAGPTRRAPARPPGCHDLRVRLSLLGRGLIASPGRLHRRVMGRRGSANLGSRGSARGHRN